MARSRDKQHPLFGYLRAKREARELEPQVPRGLKEWASLRGISPQALSQEGVPDEILRAAGYRKRDGSWRDRP